MRHAVALIVFGFGVAAAGPARPAPPAAPAYPVMLTHQTPAAIADREAAFRRDNPQHWLTVHIDELGFVREAVTDDPALLAADVAGLRDFARHNQDYFHIRAADADRLSPTPVGAALVDQLDGAVLGSLRFTRTDKQLGIESTFFVSVAPKVKPADLTRRLAARVYTDIATYGFGPPLDCSMVQGGGNCPTTTLGVVRRDVKISADDVHVETILHRDGDTLRLVVCADLSTLTPPPPDPHWAGSPNPKWQPVGVVERHFAGSRGAEALPLVVDAVTGDVVATAAARCSGLRNFR